MNRQRSLRLALSWFSGTYRSSERGEPRGARRGGREEGSTNPTIQTTRRRTIQSKHAWFPPPRWFHPPAVSLPPTCRSPPGALEVGEGQGGTSRGKELVGPPLCTSGYILDKELSRSSARGRQRISPANKGTALFLSVSIKSSSIYSWRRKCFRDTDARTGGTRCSRTTVSFGFAEFDPKFSSRVNVTRINPRPYCPHELATASPQRRLRINSGATWHSRATNVKRSRCIR